MNAPVQNMTNADMLTDAIVLRVIGGRQDGANYRLARGIRVSLGHGFNHDIILRTPGTKGLSLSLELDEALASVTLVSGYADILGRAITPGETVKLPLYVPIGFGDVAIAIGDQSSDRWAEVTSISAAVEASAAPVTESNPETTATAIPNAKDVVTQLITRGQAVSDRWNLEKRWPIIALAAAALLLSIVLFPAISGWVGEETNGKAAVQRRLNSVGLSELVVTEKADGGILITGLVKNDAALTKLRNIAAKFQNAEIDVDTMDSLAASAEGILLAQNIDATVRSGRDRSLIVEAEYLPADRQEELTSMIRRDIPLITKVTFKTDDARGEQDLQYFFSNREMGLATYVDGDPAYIKTADGSTWFKGAQVPTGHVITDIGNGSIQFERAGRIEILKVADPEISPDISGEATQTVTTTVGQP
jgi:type III secretion protein D